MITEYRFQEIHHREERRGPCPVCGKKRSRSRTFTNTVNPFNKDPETGEPKTVKQVTADVRAAGAAWVPDFACAGHLDSEVCAVVGHTPSAYRPRCTRCRVLIAPTDEAATPLGDISDT